MDFTIIEALLIKMLEMKGVLTSTEAKSIKTIKSLYDLLTSAGELDVLSNDDQKGLVEFEKIVNGSGTLQDKLVLMRRLKRKVENEAFRSLIEGVEEFAKKYGWIGEVQDES